MKTQFGFLLSSDLYDLTLLHVLLTSFLYEPIKAVLYDQDKLVHFTFLSVLKMTSCRSITFR